MQKRHSFKPALLAVALVGCFATAAQAAEEPVNQQELGPVVVTASRVEQLQKDAIPDTILISQETLQQKKLADLPSILRSEAGIEFSRTGGAGLETSLFMRGTDSRQVLLLIDGVPVIDAAGTGTVDTLSHLMPDQIDHIEVVKGNVSSIYGSGAVGGVIQVFTKQGTDTPQANAFIEYGRYDTVKFGANLSGKTDLGTSYAFSVTRAKTNGFSATNSSYGVKDEDGSRNVGATAAVSHKINENHEIGARLYYHHDKFEYDDNTYGSNGIANSRSQQVTAAVYAKNKFTSNWVSTITASRTELKRNDWDSSKDKADFYNTNFKSETNMLQWNNQIAINSDWTVTAGAEFGHEKATFGSESSPMCYPGWGCYPGNSDSTAHKRDKESIYSGVLGNVGAHHFQANIRYDHVEDSGADFTGYLGYGFDITDEWKVLASISSSFQAPSMYQMNDSKHGAKGLESEKSKAAEFGIQYASGETTVRAMVFGWSTHDLIEYSREDSKYYNVGRARNYGIELTGSTKLYGFDIKGNLTLQNPENRDNDERLLRRAKQTASVEVGKTWGNFYGDINVQYSGGRKDTDYPMTIDNGSYTIVNLDARYDINKHLALYGRIENLFNKDYETAYGYNQTGAAAYVGINVKM